MKREQTIITKIDEKHSVLMTFYASGKPKRETHFKGNDIHGMRIEWYPNGSPKAVYNYINDRLSGKFRKAKSLTEAWNVMDDVSDGFIEIDRETLPDDADVADCYIDSDNNNSNQFECVIVYSIVREAYEKDGDWYAKYEEDIPKDCEFKRVVDSRGQILCEWL